MCTGESIHLLGSLEYNFPDVISLRVLVLVENERTFWPHIFHTLICRHLFGWLVLVFTREQVMDGDSNAFLLAGTNVQGPYLILVDSVAPPAPP